jgi:hypothetical protein
MACHRGLDMALSAVAEGTAVPVGGVQVESRWSMSAGLRMVRSSIGRWPVHPGYTMCGRLVENPSALRSGKPDDVRRAGRRGKSKTSQWGEVMRRPSMGR